MLSRRRQTSKKTPGEILFEEYLHSISITKFDFEADFAGIPQRPDYSFLHEGATVLLDVKDFWGKPDDFRPGFRFYDPYAPIRLKINEGLRKFKKLKEYSCALVLYNHDRLWRLHSKVACRSGTP